MRLAPAALALAVMAGCGGGEAPAGGGSTATASSVSTTAGETASLPTAPRTLTRADDGETYRMELGQTATLVLRDPAEPEPRLEGSSVLLIQMLNVQGAEQREWEVRAVQEGRSSIHGGAEGDAWLIRVDVG